MSRALVDIQYRICLRNLASCLVAAAGLCESYMLGRRSCLCEYGVELGDEWHPGEGCTPESIKDRRWNDEPHDFVGDGRCSACGRDPEYYLHTQCPECYANTPDEEDGWHGPDCARSGT